MLQTRAAAASVAALKALIGYSQWELLRDVIRKNVKRAEKDQETTAGDLVPKSGEQISDPFRVAN